jgi:two-component system, NarL family, sensor kinase
VRLARNPLVQFLLAGLLVLIAVVLATGVLSGRAADEEAVADARATTEVLARSVAEPAIPHGLIDGDAGAVDRFDRAVLDRLLVGDVRRIKIWTSAGRVVYSDKTQLIGDRYSLGQDELDVLHLGGSDAEISDLSKAENRYERGQGGLLEVYTRIASPEGEPLLFEAYYSVDDIAARRAEVFAAFRPITLGGLLALVLVTAPMLWALTRRLARAGQSRERLLRAAVNASEAERRRIARDLHDGVVQDLAGTAFALSATARRPDTGPETRQLLLPLDDSLRASLRSLRSLLVEIYPPDLDADGLPAALDDLVASASGAGVRSSVEVGELGPASADSVALVWRVAQEAVRNALRHARCTRLEVTVSRVADALVLHVIDDGVGFVPSAVAGRNGLGLRGLRDLIAEAGGRLEVLTRPGKGTTVLLEVRDR